MADCETKQSESEPPGARSLKTSAQPSQNRLQRIVTLVSNMKKSPWLLSRCRESSSHVQALTDLLQPDDAITVAVKLENPIRVANLSRYLVVVSTGDKQGIQESAILGVDIIDDVVTVGLVLPITDNMDIQMDGDGGFNICADNGKHSFHPVSVQAMWSALQSLFTAVCLARYRHQNLDRAAYAWDSHYCLSSPQEYIFEWNRIVDADLGSQAPADESKDDLKLLLSIKRKLRDIMTNEKDIDLENVTSKYLREKLETALNMNLTAYKRVVDEEMVVVMRQMDSPSLILDYLYLGSEWNASNLEELKQNRIGYILNVTREIDNFFPGIFKYCNVRVDDVEQTQLIRHWDSTYKFIEEAKKNNSRILVHCKMGVSRSASTVIAYVMKECGKPYLEAYQYVKQKRGCVKPNTGFLDQLNTYEGILGASKQRHNKLFRSRSAETLDSEIATEEDQGRCRPKRLKKHKEAETEDAEDENMKMESKQSNLSSEDVSAETGSAEEEPKSRPATFSIDSVDSFCPDLIPAISILKEETQTLEEVEEADDEVLFDSIGPGVTQVDGRSLLPMAVLNDPALPITSMLRKLSIQNETIEFETGRKHEEFLKTFRKIKKEESIAEAQVRTRSNSWPQRRREIRTLPALKEKEKEEASIIRPNASKHRDMRKHRSITVAYDN